MSRGAATLGVLVLLSGCTTVGRYEPKHFAEWRIAADKKLDGRALVLTTPEEDAYVWSGRPTGFVGSAITLTIPFGVLARESATRVFGDLFTGGAAASNEPSHVSDYRAVISPRVIAFQHRYTWSSLFTQSSEFSLSARVSLLDAHGAARFEKTYDSGRLEVPGREDLPAAESLVRAVHIAIQDLMLQAAADVRAELVRSTPAPAGPTAGSP